MGLKTPVRAIEFRIYRRFLPVEHRVDSRLGQGNLQDETNPARAQIDRGQTAPA